MSSYLTTSAGSKVAHLGYSATSPSSHNPNNVLNALTQDQQLEVEYFLLYAEGSLQHIQMGLLINSVSKYVAPVRTKKMVSKFTKANNNGYYKYKPY
ncbi:hypothetical protein Cantr_00067 [Candida viswanathii]|uniref:Uncharacterized protein n=1 Tax=Candida viswanathii TaxID=5486 RepID=A0A367YFQ2_9ASCO|nr:hypothetical protein Cantr_00067 [Candida viswanathii]